MEIRISNLKTEFNNISLVRSKIISVFDSLKNKSDKLKMIYSEFIKNTNTQLFVFGLDSFHFQSKLIDLEYDDMKRIFLFVNNRMYCEYFKLYKIICSYVIGNVTDKKIIEIIKGNNFPVYKDLEPFKDYKFETTLEIHENILVLLNSIASIINNRENELSIHRSKQLIGLNIDNFVNSFNYEITLMREKVNLFLSYIEFFHKLHAKYLKRFSNKIQLMSNHINSDIQFDENIENNNNHKINDSASTLDEEEQINETINDNKNNVNLDIIFDSKHAKHSILDDYEYQSGLNTPSSESYVSTESMSKSSKSNKKIKMPKFIKNGIKKVTNIINGCNNKLTNDISYDNYDNNKLLVQPLSLNNPNLTIVLSDFDDNVNEDENGVENISENNNNNNEKETQTEEPVETEEPEIVVEPLETEETQESAETTELEVVEETVEPLETEESEIVVEPLETEETQEPEIVVEPLETEETQEPEIVAEPLETEETQEPEIVVEPLETEETQEPEIVVEPLETVETEEPEIVVEPLETVETQEPEVVEETQETTELELVEETVESEESELESP